MATILGELIVLLIAAVILRGLWLGMVKRPQQLRQAWSELAERTGLTFDPGQGGLFGNRWEPMVYGEYHGRSVNMAKLIENVGSGDASVQAVYTQITLYVVNPADFSLTLEEKHLFTRLFRKKSVPSGEQDFDHRFIAKGSPSEFVQRALRLLALHKALLLQRPKGVILVTDNSFSGTLWRRPSIKLKGSELVCRTSGVLTEVGVQIEFLDLFHDLAELVEMKQEQVVTPTAYSETGQRPGRASEMADVTGTAKEHHRF